MTKKVNITVQVTYEVTMECEVANDVLESMEYSMDNHPKGINGSTADWDRKVTPALEWLTDNCSENKCVDWYAEIQDLTYSKED